MSKADQIEIVTIYSASHSPRSRSRVRILGLLSLAVAGAWLWALHYHVDPWLKNRLIIAGLSAMGEFIGPQDQQKKPLTPEQRAELKAKAEEIGLREVVRQGARYGWTRIAYLAGVWLAWAGVAGLLGRAKSLRRGGWLMIFLSVLVAIGSVAYALGLYNTAFASWLDQVRPAVESLEFVLLIWIGVAGAIGIVCFGAVRMHRQAALLMLLSAGLSVAAIWAAIKWGGMPPDADLALYGKVAATQAAYPVFLMIASRFMR